MARFIAAIQKPFQEFRSFDRNIIRYMAMHWAGGSLLIYATLLPVFMNKLGIDVVDAGVIFSLAALFDVVFTYVIGKFLDRISPNVGMGLDWVTESLPAIIYGLASTSLHFLMGTISKRVTNVLNPVYKVYENEIFPEEQRSLIYTYHLMTPEIFNIIVYAVVGYLLAFKFTSVLAFRVVFLVCGIGYLFVAMIPFKGLKWIEPVELAQRKNLIKLPKELYVTASAQIFMAIGSSFASSLITCYYILEKMNGTVFDILMLQVIMSAVVVITGLFSKNLERVLPQEKTAQYGVLCFVIFALLMVGARNYTVVVMANLFQAIGNTIWFPRHYSLLMKYVPKEKRGEFFSSLSSVSKLIDMVTPAVSAILAQKLGFFVPFALAFVAYAAVFVVYQLLLKRGQRVDVMV